MEAQARGEGNAFSAGSNRCSSSAASAGTPPLPPADHPAPSPSRRRQGPAQGQMDKPAGQGAGHPRSDGAVAFAITGGEDAPAVGQTVFTQGTVKHELIAGRLDQRRAASARRGTGCRRRRRAERRDGPRGLALFHRGQPAQIDRIEQDGADVEQTDAKRRRDLGDDLGLTDARWSPDKRRFLDTAQQVQRRCDFGWFHGSFP